MAPRLDAPIPIDMSADTFLGLYRDLKAARQPMETAVAAYRNVLGRMKKDGVDLFAVSILERLVKAEEAQATIHLRNLTRYAGWTNASVGLSQGNLFGEPDDAGPSSESAAMFGQMQAEEAGYRAGAAGLPGDDIAHPVGSPTHTAWGRGWNAGQKKLIIASFGKKPKAAPEPKTETRRARQSPDPIYTAPSEFDDVPGTLAPKPAKAAKAAKAANGRKRIGAAAQSQRAAF